MFHNAANKMNLCITRPSRKRFTHKNVNVELLGVTGDSKLEVARILTIRTLAGRLPSLRLKIKTKLKPEPSISLHISE